MASIGDLAVTLSLDSAGFIRGLGGASTSFAGFGGAVGGTAGIVVGVLKDLALAGIRLAGAAEPGLYAQLGDAWDDLHAVIGRAFVPILKAALPLVQLIGDALATVTPFFASFLDGLLSMVNIVSQLGTEFAQAWGFSGAARGAAATQASFTSADAFASKIQSAAFGGSIQDRQLEELQGIHGYMRTLGEILSGGAIAKRLLMGA